MAKAVIFSGGTAFRDTARALAALKCDITYIITAFDSGGSSQALRRAFAMPAVGDLRNRLLAIARDEAAAGALNVRLDADEEKARQELKNFNIGQRLAAVDEPVRSHMGADLETVLSALPQDFQSSRASVGNLALAGAWLNNGGDLLGAVRRYGKMLRCMGEVIPICEADVQLAARLKNGQIIGHQHLFKKLSAPVQELFLASAEGDAVVPEAAPEALAAIGRATEIFYPMGSFYSSILANFLPKGVARALEASRANKTFIPNAGVDAETRGMSIVQQARAIINTLARKTGKQDNFLDFVLVDWEVDYPGGAGALSRDLLSMNITLLPAVIAPDGKKHLPDNLAWVIEAMLTSG